MLFRSILAGAGVYGLLGGSGALLPILAEPGVAWLCIAFGVGLMALAMGRILKRIIQQRTAASGARASRGRD